ECKIVQPLWKTIWRFLKKLKTDLLYDPAIPTLGSVSKGDESRSQRDLALPCSAVFTVAKVWKPPTCPSTDEWIKKMCYIHGTEYYTALRRKEILQYATTWVNPENVVLSEIGQPQKDKYCVIPLI
ncbi:LORF2 protein, partial [Crocuta crocuta]